MHVVSRHSRSMDFAGRRPPPPTLGTRGCWSKCDHPVRQGLDPVDQPSGPLATLCAHSNWSTGWSRINHLRRGGRKNSARCPPSSRAAEQLPERFPIGEPVRLAGEVLHLRGGIEAEPPEEGGRQIG